MEVNVHLHLMAVLSPTKEILVSSISKNDWGASPKSVERRKISFPAGNRISNPGSFSLYYNHYTNAAILAPNISNGCTKHVVDCTHWLRDKS